MVLAAERPEPVQQPLPLVLPGALAVGKGIAVLEDEKGTGAAVFVWGQASWTWDSSDRVRGGSPRCNW